MATLFVARSAKLADWASDVGLSKNIYKIGVTDDPVADVVVRGWAGETDWTLIKQIDDIDLTEDEAVERVARKEKHIDPRYYPRLREAQGVFKVNPDSVSRGIMMARALEGENERAPVKLKPVDFANHLIGIVRGGLAL